MKKVFFLLLLSLLGNILSYAQALYGLDPTFSNNGIYIGDTGSFGKIAIQNDDKILALGGGKANLMRFNVDGTIDKTFADSGYFTHKMLNLPLPVFRTIALQPDGKILLGGSADTGITDYVFLLTRLKQDGSLDSSFGGGGYVMTGYIHVFGPGAREEISSLAIQPDGKILAYGYFDFLRDTLQIIRYHTDGRLDSSFGLNGRVKIQTTGFEYPDANDMALLPDGRIVVGAKTNILAINPPWGASAFTAIRLLPNGELDTSFNHTGVAYTNNNLPGLLYCKAMCVQPDGKVLLGGYADSIALARFDTTGQLDNSFGTNGLVKLDPAGKISELLLLPFGKILLAGTLDTSFVVYRLNTDGSRDMGFGSNGRITTRILNEKNGINGLGVQSTGKIIAAGNGENVPYPNNFPTPILLRYTENATTLSEMNLTDHISIYPNPATDYIYVDNPGVQRISHIKLYSIGGKQLLTQTHPHTNKLSTEGLADGVYFLHIRLADHTTIVKKIIIQKN